MNTHTKMLQLASLDPATVSSSNTQPRERFLEIINGFASIHQGKSEHYGDYIASLDLDNTPEAMTLAHLHSDIKRKWTRLDSLIKKRVAGGCNIDFDDLIDTLSDMGVYSAMCIDAIVELQEIEGQS